MHEVGSVCHGSSPPCVFVGTWSPEGEERVVGGARRGSHEGPSPGGGNEGREAIPGGYARMDPAERAMSGLDLMSIWV